jgi:hypothetical protein
MPIIQYANRVFTNDGQSTVAGFAAKLAAAAVAITAAGAIRVYVGYHGDLSGGFFQRFNAGEMAAVHGMAGLFPMATLYELAVEMTDLEIREAVNGGDVFFTWCDSDTRVRRVMGCAMPAEVARY